MSTLKLPLNSNVCRCPTCGLAFKSAYGFDAHRVGQHGVDRRCLTEDELLGIGYRPSPAGLWRKPRGSRGGIRRAA